MAHVDPNAITLREPPVVVARGWKCVLGLAQEVPMLAIQLPDDIEQRLDALVLATGRSKEATLVEAIAEYLDDLEDLAVAERRLADIRAGRAGTTSLADLGRELGLAD